MEHIGHFDVLGEFTSNSQTVNAKRLQYVDHLIKCPNINGAPYYSITEASRSAVINGGSVVSHPGITNLVSGTASGTYGCIVSEPSFIFGGGVTKIETYFKTPAVFPVVGEDAAFVVGFCQNPTILTGTEPTTLSVGGTDALLMIVGIDGNIYCYNKKASTTSGILAHSTLAISTWYKFTIEVNALGTSVDYSLNDVIIHTDVTNIPIISLRQITGLLRGTVGTTLDYTYQVDAMGYDITIN